MAYPTALARLASRLASSNGKRGEFVRVLARRAQGGLDGSERRDTSSIVLSRSRSQRAHEIEAAVSELYAERDCCGEPDVGFVLVEILVDL